MEGFMYNIEVYEDTTLEGLLSSFKNLSEAGIVGCVKINGVTILGTDPHLEEKLTNLKKKKKRKKPIIKKRDEGDIEKKLAIALEHLIKVNSLSQNEVFKYYLGVCLQYIKPEYCDEFKKIYVQIYTNDKYICLRDIHLLASILLILEYKNPFLIQEKLNQFFLSVSREDIEKMNAIFFKTIEKYAVRGNLVARFFPDDILDDVVRKSREEVDRLVRVRDEK